MPGLGGILSVAAGALGAHERATQVTANNIANAQTPGYSRQEARLVPGTPLRTPQGEVGTGVRLVDVARSRDVFLDAAYRRERALASGADARHTTLGRVELALGEPSDDGLAASLDAFWNAWSDLAASPLESAPRTVVRETARRLTGRLNDLAVSVESAARQTVDQLRTGAEKLDTLARQVAQANVDIVAAEAGGRSAPDLRDHRDRLIDQIAELVSVRVIEQPGGAANLLVGSTTLVDGSEWETLEAARTDGAWGLRTTGGRGVADAGGSLGALAGTVNGELARLAADLDALAGEVVAQVNALHDPDGTGVPIFDPAATSAATIRLAAGVEADAGVIRAGSGGAASNDVALAIAALRDETGAAALGGATFGGFYGAALARLGAAVEGAGSDAGVHTMLAERAASQRAAVSDVSIDEELTRLIQQQTAYGAAARLVTTVDEMLETLLGMGR